MKSNKLWVAMALLIPAIFIMLPIEVYDLSPTLIVMLGAGLSGIMIHFALKSTIDLSGSMLNITVSLLATLLLFFNLTFYQSRRDGLLSSSGKTVNGRITERVLKNGKKTSHHFEYTYQVAGKQYRASQKVDFDVYMNFELDDLIIEYVEGRPSISRIKRSSLIPDPNAHEQFMEWQKNRKQAEHNN